MTARPFQMVPDWLVNKREPMRHYAIAAVKTRGAPSTKRLYWCQIPQGFAMAFWKLQPGDRPFCGKCMDHARAIGAPPSADLRADRELAP